jgi:signal transduction histidine kinase/ligand-binding sensor domain-containing protein
MESYARFLLRVAGLLCGAFLAWQPAAARALDPARLITQYGLDVWLTRDGLPQNSVKAIVQTRDGYLWLGTWGGLARFDGVRFTIFNRANTPALGDNRITALAEGADGSLWIGTAQAGLIRLKDGVFESYRSESNTSYEERSRWQIRSIAVSRDGGLWIGTSGSGFRRFKNGRFGPLLMDRHVVGTILEDAAGHLWVQTRDDVLELAWNEGKALQVLRQLPNLRFSDIYQDRVGTIWIAHRRGLTRISGGRVTTFGRAEGFPADAALSIWGDRDGNLWIGTNGEGLVRMRGEQFDVLTVRDGLSNGFIAALYEDREGSLWIGSNDGLNRLRDTRFTAITAREGLSVDAVNSIVAGRDGTVWISTDGGGLNRLQASRITTYTTANGLPANYTGALFEASDGSLWISGDGVITHLRNGRFHVYTRADGVPAGFVSAIGETRDGGIVMCGEGPERELKEGRFVPFGQEPAEMEYCYSMTRDRRGDLWFATTGGLVHVSNGGPRLYTTRDGLPDEGVHSIYEDKTGTIWIPTVSGLSLLKDGRITSFSTLGPLGEVIFEILEDDAGHLWMNGRQGILKVAKSELEAYAAGQRRDVTIGVYGLMDGLKSTEYNAAYIQRPAARTPDGRLWFATTQGIVSIDPSVDWLNRLPPPLAIETFVADGQADARRPPQVAAGTNTFEIHYTALSLLAPSRVRFAYQLEGLDPRWIDAGTRRVALYSRVPPGHYRFHLRAANNDGVWNDNGATLDIRVLPYFYQTLWFRLSSLGLVAFAVFGLHRMRMRRVETRFALVMKERNRIAREIHDTLAQGLAGIGLHLAAIEHEPSAESREQHVGTARRLVRASLAEAHRSIWNLRPEYLDHSNLIAGLERMASDLSEGGDMQIEISTSGVARPLSAAIETNVFRIAQEAVANAIRHADARRIRVRLEFERDAVRLTVADDGHGFDPAASSEGFGLTSMRERAAQIGAVLRVEGRSPAGASVTLSVPVEPAEDRGVVARVATAVQVSLQRASRLPAMAANAVRAIGSRTRRWFSRLSH